MKIPYFKDKYYNLNTQKCWKNGKISYDKKGAISATNSVGTKRRLGVKNLRAYSCPFCPNWHITTRMSKEKY